MTVLRELSPLHRELRRAIPDVYAGFGDLHRAAFASGALDAGSRSSSHGPATIHGARAYDAFCEFATARDTGESAA
jgi:hypothetical protein